MRRISPLKREVKRQGPKVRGPYMRREARKAGLEKDPNCEVLDEVTVHCKECCRNIILDRRPKALSSPTGGYYGSNWRKHWKTKHARLGGGRRKAPLHDTRRSECLAVVNAGGLLAQPTSSAPLFLPDPDSEPQVNGSPQSIPPTPTFESDTEMIDELDEDELPMALTRDFSALFLLAVTAERLENQGRHVQIRIG